MRAWLWQLLGRLVPQDLWDVDLGDVDVEDPAFVPAPLTAATDCIVAGCRWGAYASPNCECD